MTSIPDDKRRWHFGKEIPLAVLSAIAFQSFAIIWWAAGISSDVRDLSRRTAVLEIKTDSLVKTVNDSAAPAAVNAVQIQTIFTQLGELRGQVDAARGELRSLYLERARRGQ